MLKAVNNISKRNSHEIENVVKKNFVGDLKIWKYFRTRFAEAHPPRLLVSPDTPEPQRHKILVILMGHQKMPKICDVNADKKSELRGQMRLKLARSHTAPL